MRASRIPDGYVQLDVILEQPATRVLRALRWFDWAESFDIYTACNVGDHERSAFSAALARLAKDKLIERGGKLFRITAAGRVELARRLNGESRVQAKRRAA